MHTFHLPSCWFCRNQQKLEVIVILGGVCVVCVFVVLVCVCVWCSCVFVKKLVSSHTAWITHLPY